MVWQDSVISAVQLVFVISLIPQIYKGFKYKRGTITTATSAPTFIGLFVMSFCLYTLSLFFSAITAALTGVLWLILFIQRMSYRN